MLIEIITPIELDPGTTTGLKNLQLLLSAAGIRSQINFRGIKKKKNEWVVQLELERPGYWGDRLELLREDLDNLVLTDHGSPAALKTCYKLAQLSINNEPD